MAYYWVTFQYDGEDKKERFVEGAENLKDFVKLIKGYGAKINLITNQDYKDVTKRYDK